MKKLRELTEEEARKICEILHEPFLSYMVNDDGKWGNLEVQIETTSTINGDSDDSCIWICNTGEIQLHRNNGDWGGCRYEAINTYPIIMYLLNGGYIFDPGE